MSLVVSSTTDSQEAVNAAAGIVSDAGAATAPAESAETPAESQPPQPTTPEEPKTEEEEPDEQEDSGKEPAKKKGGFQRKIERLEREKEYAFQRAQEAEAALAATRKPDSQPKPPVEQAKPRLDQFTDPEEYVDKLTDWKLAQREADMARAAAERQYLEQNRQLQERWQENLAGFRESVEDFDEILAATDHIRLAEPLQQAIKRSEFGPRLLYELARQPKEARRIAQLDPVDAIRELGRLEARFTSSPNDSEGAKPIAPHTKAPPPIRPVGGGGPTTTVPPDQMPYQQYKAWRKKHGAR